MPKTTTEEKLVSECRETQAKPSFHDAQSGLNYKHDRVVEDILSKLRASYLSVSEGIEILDRVKRHIGNKRI